MPHAGQEQVAGLHGHGWIVIKPPLADRGTTSSWWYLSVVILLMWATRRPIAGDFRWTEAIQRILLQLASSANFRPGRLPLGCSPLVWDIIRGRLRCSALT